MSNPVIQRLRAQLSRRDVLRRIFWSTGAVASASALSACGNGSSAALMVPPASPAPGSAAPAPTSRFANLGPLQSPDANGLMLPMGFTSRVVAVSGLPPLTTKAFLWHPAPDGGATYQTADGGWVYTSNSEVPSAGDLGGCGALRFDKDGVLIDAYSILTGTTGNCAGGKTPWGTWMSCEEFASGEVWECDPFKAGQGKVITALGKFNREAVAVDDVNKIIYMTEDASSGRFYRFIPTAADWPMGAARPALLEGKMQVLRYMELATNVAPGTDFNVEMVRPVVWDDVVMPLQPQATVRAGLGAMAPGTPFRGGEGLWYYQGLVYFSTKGDNRIWCYDHPAQALECIYDFNTAKPENKILSGVDNLTLTETGEVLVAEDGGDMDICVILPDRNLVRLVKASDTFGQSEITGPAFSPDGTRLYFSAQRNGRNGVPGPGITFEVTLPFSVCPSGTCPPMAPAA